MNFGKRAKQRIRQHLEAVLPLPTDPLSKRIFVWAVLTVIAGTLGLLFIFTITIGILAIGLPDVRDFDKLAGVESTLIMDRDGGILYAVHGEENRKYVPLSEISPLLQKATVAIEDDEFYEHGGFDIPALVAAGLHEVFGLGDARGGSTITQQLAKNAFLTRRKEYIRKLKELILAVRLEQAYDKDKILELYLNRIPYGHNAYGVELASNMYLGKSARLVTLGESAILAALPQAPSYYSPYGPHAYSKLEREFDATKEKLPKTIYDLREDDYTIGLMGRKVSFSPTQSIYIPGRTDLILKRMLDLGYITQEERAAAEKEIQEINFQKYKETIKAPHFVFEIQDELTERLGKEVLAQGGLQVYTTLDPELQTKAETIVADQIKVSKDLHGVTNGALFSIDAKTGQVLAMVGSADYFDDEARGKNNHVFAKRQPGSSFKPFIYAKAFLNRYAPATVLYDTPTDFGGNYKPQNYEGGFKGPMSIRQALGQSRNIPAIKAYFLAGQQEEVIDLVSKMGINTLQKDFSYGPALALGAGEVRLADMVQGFSVFANGGIKRDYYSILKVVDRQGDVLYERKPEDSKDQEVLDPQVAYLINSILSDKSVYLGPRLNVPGHTTAAKTGTSNKEITPVKILPNNLWTMGYTPSVVTGVWAGNSDGSALKANADGYNVAAPIWAKFMAEALKDTPDEQFPRPEGIKTVTVSRASGKLPSAATPDNGRISDVFASFSVPTEIDDMYREIEVNELDGKLPNKYTPPERIKKKFFINHKDPIDTYPSWLAGIRSWIAGAKESGVLDFPPTEETDMFNELTEEKKPTIQITFPSTFSVINNYEKFLVSVHIEAPNGVDRVVYYLDDKAAPSSIVRRSPYGTEMRIPKNAEPGPHVITARVYDKVGYVEEAKIEIRFDKPSDSASSGSFTGTTSTPPPPPPSSGLLENLLN